jgi:alpha-tubulin suppressor-like RCC1 family protein
MRTDGTAWGAGRNEYGELGQGNTTSYSSPVQVGSLTDWQLSFGMLYGMRCLKTDGTMWLAGYNGNGQLGDGTTTAKSSPIQVGSITNWGKLLSGSSSTKATQID